MAYYMAQVTTEIHQQKLFILSIQKIHKVISTKSFNSSIKVVMTQVFILIIKKTNYGQSITLHFMPTIFSLIEHAS